MIGKSQEGKGHAVPPIDVEAYYTPAQISQRWGLATDSVVRIFRDQPDVFRPFQGLIRKRQLIRVPGRVLLRYEQQRLRGFRIEVKRRNSAV
jgi:hypothetical protein